MNLPTLADSQALPAVRSAIEILVMVRVSGYKASYSLFIRTTSYTFNAPQPKFDRQLPISGIIDANAGPKQVTTISSRWTSKNIL